MEEENKDKIIQLYLRVMSLKNNLPTGSISERYVQEYSDIVNSFVPLIDNVNLNDFQIADSDLEKHLVSFNPLTGEKNYSNERYIEHGLFLSKVDAFSQYIKVKFKEFLSNL